MGIVAWYEINKTYVAKVLCENKDKPQMKCCGKCYLNKQLKKTEGSTDGKQLPVKTEKTEPAIMHIAGNIIPPVFIAVNTLVHHAQYTSPQGYNGIADIFHPPPYIA